MPGSRPNANVGLPLVPSGLPSRPISFPWSELSFRLKIWPVAVCTPSRPFTRSSTAAGTVGEPLCANETVDLPVITAAVSLYEPAKIWSNADLIVSVRT